MGTDLHQLAPAPGPHGGLKQLSRYLRSARGGILFPPPQLRGQSRPRRGGPQKRNRSRVGVRRTEAKGPGIQAGGAAWGQPGGLRILPQHPVLSIPSSASRPQHPPRVLRGGQVAEQPGWEQGKPCGMPGAGRHRAVVHGQEAEVTTEESASFGKVPYVLRAFKTSSLLFRMGGEV